MNTSLQHIINYISTAPTADLQHILNSVQNELPKRKAPHIPLPLSSDYVEYIDNFCKDSSLLEDVWTELESMDLPSKATKIASQWISNCSDPYVFNDNDPIHKAKPMDNFPSIGKLLGLVNNNTEITGPLDSCLVVKYNSDKAALRLHCDSEQFIDQQKSICSFTLGSDRIIEFWEKSKKKPKLVKTINMSHNGLVVMKPGTQQRLNHCVRSDPSSGKPDLSKVRYCLSFRAVSIDGSTTELQQPATSAKSDSMQQQQLPPQHAPPPKRVCLIAGDSYAARMDIGKLGKGKVVVDSVAEGGAKMKKVVEQLETYRATHPDNKVLKIVVSVGTNDIRNCEGKGIGHLKAPIKELCNHIQQLYPDSKVFFQSLLPLPLKHENDWATNSIVMHFNRMIWFECVYRRFYYIDVFHPFCRFYRRRNQPHSRFDKLFEENGIHPNKGLGMGVLARFYIKAFHSNLFNPGVYQ